MIGLSMVRAFAIIMLALVILIILYAMTQLTKFPAKKEDKAWIAFIMILILWVASGCLLWILGI